MSLLQMSDDDGPKEIPCRPMPPAKPKYLGCWNDDDVKPPKKKKHAVPHHRGKVGTLFSSGQFTFTDPTLQCQHRAEAAGDFVMAVGNGNQCYSGNITTDFKVYGKAMDPAFCKKYGGKNTIQVYTWEDPMTQWHRLMKNYHEPGKPKPTPYKPKYGPLDNKPVKAEKWPKVLELDAELMDEADAEVTGGGSFLETGATMQNKKLPDCKPGQTKDLKDMMGRDTCNPIKFCKPKPTPVPTLSPEQLKAKKLREFRANAKALKVKPATGYMKLRPMNTVLPAYTPTPTPAMQAIPANEPMLIAVPKARRCLYVHPKHNALALARCDHALKREKFYYGTVCVLPVVTPYLSLEHCTNSLHALPLPRLISLCVAFFQTPSPSSSKLVDHRRPATRRHQRKSRRPRLRPAMANTAPSWSQPCPRSRASNPCVWTWIPTPI